jgi:hypothetical protein
LEVLTTSELLDLRDYADPLIKQRMHKERRDIERTLTRISEATEERSTGGRGSKMRAKVAPKYRDPRVVRRGPVGVLSRAGSGPY